jgi:selenoprotein W-related protein
LKSGIEKNFPGAKIKLIPSGGGVFEVVKDGKLIFSKKSLGRFPEHSEIFAKLK